MDWNALLLQTSKLKHSQRRKLIKKLKRSFKRKALATSCSSQTPLVKSSNKSSVNDGDDKQSQPRFACLYDCLAREVVLQTLNDLVFLVCNPSSIIIADRLQPTKKDFQQQISCSISKSNDTIDFNTKNDRSPLSQETLIENNDDAEKTIETERFLLELDEELKKWHNPFLPDSESHVQADSEPIASTSTVPNVLKQPTRNTTSNGGSISNQPKLICQFFEKVGSCRFGDNCSRLHNTISSGKTLLISGMFTTFAFEIMKRAKKTQNGDIGDMWMEHSDADLYDEFVEFYNDVVPELESYGKVIQFKVCCNRDKHLLGNVYVQYKHEKDAIVAAEHLSGRYYGGKHLNVKFVSINSWKSAICGLHYNNRNCPRGHHCNFLHVFKEPSRRFYEADTDTVRHRHVDRDRSYNNSSTRKHFDKSGHMHRSGRKHSSRYSDSPREKVSKKSRHKDSFHEASSSRYSGSPREKKHKKSKDSERKHKKSLKKHEKKQKHKKRDRDGG